LPGIVPVEPEGSKLARVNAVAGAIESGNVYLPQSAPWVQDFVEECAGFPNAANDDQVDGMSQALIRLLGVNTKREPPKSGKAPAPMRVADRLRGMGFG